VQLCPLHVLLDLLLVCLVSKPHIVILCLQEMLVSILLCWRKHIKIDYSFSKFTSLLMKIFLIDLLYNLYAFIVWITPNKGVGYWYSSKLVDYVILGYVYMSKTSKSSNILKFDLTSNFFHMESYMHLPWLGINWKCKPQHWQAHSTNVSRFWQSVFVYSNRILFFHSKMLYGCRIWGWKFPLNSMFDAKFYKFVWHEFSLMCFQAFYATFNNIFYHLFELMNFSKA